MVLRLPLGRVCAHAGGLGPVWARGFGCGGRLAGSGAGAWRGRGLFRGPGGVDAGCAGAGVVEQGRGAGGGAPGPASGTDRAQGEDARAELDCLSGNRPLLTCGYALRALFDLVASLGLASNRS
jgi:hypothetical protein